jgi:hypothetical protein
VKLDLLVHPSAVTRFDPCPIRERTAKLSPRPLPLEPARFDPRRFLGENRGDLLPTPVRRRLRGFTPATSCVVCEKYSLLISTRADSFGLTLTAIPELTREVSLPDQSGRIVGAAQKVSKSNLAETLWKYVQTCARNSCGESG